MKQITDCLYQIPSAADPLSADVFILNGDKYVYIFDVGNNEESLGAVSDIPKEKVVILSHPHNDHVGNIRKLNYQNLYVGDATYDKLQIGTVIRGPLTIHDGITLEIRPCPSPHTPGSLILTINNEYTLLADLYFTRPDYDRALAMEMLVALKALNTAFFVVSHQDGPCIFPKAYVVKELAAYFNS